MSESVKNVFREMRAAGESRERMLEFSRQCGCMGCGLRGKPCECGQRCYCRCTLPAVIAERAKYQAGLVRMIDEVLAEPQENRDERTGAKS